MREGELISSGDLAHMRYPPVKMITGIVQDITASTTANVVDISDLTNDDLFVQMVDTTTGQNASIVKQVKSDNFTSPQVNTSQEPDGSAATLERWSAHKSLSFAVKNTSASTVSNYQASAGLWKMYGSLAERVRIAADGDLTKYTGLTPQDTADLDLIGHQHFMEQLAAGLRPITPSQMLDRQEIHWRSYPIATTVTTSPLQRVSVGGQQHPTFPGYAIALGAVAIDTSVGGSITLANQVADDIQIHVSTEYGTDLDVWPGYVAASGLSTVFKPLIVGLQYVNVELSAKAAVSNVPVRPVFYQFPVSDILHVRWNTPTGRTIAQQRPKFAAQVRLGFF